MVWGQPREPGCAARGLLELVSPPVPALLLAQGLVLTTARCSTGLPREELLRGRVAVTSKGELALTVVVEEFCGCSGYLRKE